jgi:hypothetical protein
VRCDIEREGASQLPSLHDLMGYGETVGGRLRERRKKRKEEKRKKGERSVFDQCHFYKASI